MIIGAMVVTGWDLYMFYLPIYAHSIELPASTIGLMLGAFAAATFIVRFSLPFLTRRYNARRVLSVSMFCAAAMFVLFPFVTGVWLLGALSFSLGLALGCSQPVTLLLAYNRSPEGRTGEATGIRFALNHLTLHGAHRAGGWAPRWPHPGVRDDRRGHCGAAGISAARSKAAPNRIRRPPDSLLLGRVRLRTIRIGAQAHPTVITTTPRSCRRGGRTPRRTSGRCRAG